MTDQHLRRFDVAALYAALDNQRSQLGLSWSNVASHMWNLSANLNDRRRDHPVSPSTLTNMRETPGSAVSTPCSCFAGSIARPRASWRALPMTTAASLFLSRDLTIVSDGV